MLWPPRTTASWEQALGLSQSTNPSVSYSIAEIPVNPSIRSIRVPVLNDTPGPAIGKVLFRSPPARESVPGPSTPEGGRSSRDPLLGACNPVATRACALPASFV